MWLATRYGFFSVVCARQSARPHAKVDPSRLMVRARRREHLEGLKKAMPFLRECKILQSNGTDYPFRIFVVKGLFASVLASLVDDIDYDNFKNEAHHLGDQKYNAFLSNTWNTGLRMEDDGRLWVEVDSLAAERARDDLDAETVGAVERKPSRARRPRKKKAASGKG